LLLASDDGAQKEEAVLVLSLIFFKEVQAALAKGSS